MQVEVYMQVQVEVCDAGSLLWYVLQEKGKLKKEGYKYRVPILW